MGYMRAEDLGSGQLNVTTGGNLSIAELMLALDIAKAALMDNLRRGAAPLDIPGMLKGNLKRVPA